MLGNNTEYVDCSVNKFLVAGKSLAVAGVINTERVLSQMLIIAMGQVM